MLLTGNNREGRIEKVRYIDNMVKDLKLAYIGGGSTGWAWQFMSDLAASDDISGDVYLYDIDVEAAKNNEIIGNQFQYAEGAKSIWNYKTAETIEEALVGADFVVISILPGTFDEMESDVHVPEKYGIYQSVGDTAGPGGIIRAMRTVPMYEFFAEKIKAFCPNAWVINYTNPMTLCVRTLYRVFPEIKAFGCCHEVFATQKLLAKIVQRKLGVEDICREEIKVNPLGVNHFTWLTSATYRDVDLFPLYEEFCRENRDGCEFDIDGNWVSSVFGSKEKVKMDLFQRFRVIAAAGDRHLAEFCEGKWYLESPERVAEMRFGLTTVKWRKEDLVKRREKGRRLSSGEDAVKIKPSQEEGVKQMRSLLGLCDFATNVNLPNQGQIPNLPLGAVVETNALFRADSLNPVFAGPVPKQIYPMVSRVCAEQELVSEGIAERDLKKIFCAFANDPLVTCGMENARKLFREMCENTKKYLTMYDLDQEI